jgi:hypothetical protein
VGCKLMNHHELLKAPRDWFHLLRDSPQLLFGPFNRLGSSFCKFELLTENNPHSASLGIIGGEIRYREACLVPF